MLASLFRKSTVWPYTNEAQERIGQSPIEILQKLSSAFENYVKIRYLQQHIGNPLRFSAEPNLTKVMQTFLKKAGPVIDRWRVTHDMWWFTSWISCKMVENSFECGLTDAVLRYAKRVSAEGMEQISIYEWNENGQVHCNRKFSCLFLSMCPKTSARERSSKYGSWHRYKISLYELETRHEKAIELYDSQIINFQKWESSHHQCKAGDRRIFYLVFNA